MRAHPRPARLRIPRVQHEVDLEAAERAVRDLLVALGPRPRRRAPGRHAPPGRRCLRRAAHPAAVRPHHLPQRRGLRRARPGPGHPVPLAVPAPPAAVHGRRPRRLPARRADPRAVQARPGRRAVRPRPPGPGAADQAGRRLAPGAPRTQGRRRGARGRAPVHVAARRAGRRRPHRHLGAARPAARRRPLPAEFFALTGSR